jgi:hypothetical protein
MAENSEQIRDFSEEFLEFRSGRQLSRPSGSYPHVAGANLWDFGLQPSGSRPDAPGQFPQLWDFCGMPWSEVRREAGSTF